MDKIKDNYSFAGTFKGIPIAIEFNGDGSVTLCKEIVDEIHSDRDVPDWLKIMVRAHDHRMYLTTKPVPNMADGFTGWTDSEGKEIK